MQQQHLPRSSFPGAVPPATTSFVQQIPSSAPAPLVPLPTTSSAAASASLHQSSASDPSVVNRVNGADVSKWSLLPTGIKADDLKKIRTAVKKLGGFLAKNLTDSTTHLIVVEEDLVVTARTVKYFQSILAGMFVVSSRWVFDSFQHEAWLPMENYEVRGDVSCLGGARKSRLLREQNGKSSSLFDSIAVYFLEPFSTLHFLNSEKHDR